jgi:integrase
MRFDSQSVVNALQKRPLHPEKKDYTIWDESMPGFGIRFQQDRAPVYILKYFVKGRQGKMSLGKVGAIQLKDAKKKAHEQFALIEDDINPAIEAAKAKVVGIRFADKIEDYVAHLGRLGRVDSYLADNRRSLKGHFEGLHKYTFADLEDQQGRALIAAELDKLARNGRGKGGAMRNARAHLHAYMKWCAEKGLLASNQVSLTTKPANGKRDRKLDPEAEIIPLWHILPKDDFGAICKLLWLTWARRDEIGSLRKSEVDRERKLIYLKGERTKNGVDHVIPLSRQAWAILEKHLDSRKGDFVFGYGQSGFSGWHKPVVRLRKALGMKAVAKVGLAVGEHFTLHDFRRTSRSLGVRRPVSILPHIAEAIMNHVSTAESGKQGVAGVYDVNEPYQYHQEKAEALQKWADYLDGLVYPKPRLEAVA